MADRLSLEALARMHARQLWRHKSDRNAELRLHGYDPNSAEGIEYRRLLEEACVTHRIAEFITQVQVGDSTFVWEIMQKDWPDWNKKNSWTMNWELLQQFLKEAIHRIHAGGGHPVMIRATVAEVVSEINALGLRYDSAGRAAAIAMIGARQMGG